MANHPVKIALEVELRRLKDWLNVQHALQDSSLLPLDLHRALLVHWDNLCQPVEAQLVRTALLGHSRILKARSHAHLVH